LHFTRSLPLSGDNSYTADVKMVINWMVLGVTMKKYPPITMLSNICEYHPVPSTSIVLTLEVITVDWGRLHRLCGGAPETHFIWWRGIIVYMSENFM